MVHVWTMITYVLFSFMSTHINMYVCMNQGQGHGQEQGICSNIVSDR